MALSWKRALVLGGGGVTGVAWELGLLAGLAQAGSSVGDADVIVGTSAGSVVAVHVASGANLDLSYARQVEGPGSEVAARMGGAGLARLLWTAVTSRTPERFGQRMGKLAAAAATGSEAARREVIASRLPTRSWPDGRLLITAVELETGVRRVLTRDDGVELGDAVAASCAVPGVWPPVTLQGRRYIDGGMHSGTNADLVTGAERVLIVAPFVAGIGILPSVAVQVGDLQRAGARVAVVSPNRASLKAIGRNVLDPTRRPPSAKAGRAQAIEEVDRVKALWQS